MLFKDYDRTELSEYLQALPMFVCVSVPLAEYLILAGIWEINRLFFCCYFLIFVMVGLLLTLFSRKKWDIPACLITIGVLSLISRDIYLTKHMVISYGIYLVITLLTTRIITDRIMRRIPQEGVAGKMLTKIVPTSGWLIIVAAELILWIKRPEVSHIVAVCIIITAVFTLALLSGAKASYHIMAFISLWIVLLLLPVRDEPVQWTTVKEAINNTKTLASRAADEIAYFFDGLSDAESGYAGYSNNGKLSGGLSKYPQEEMLFSENGRIKSIYLKGSAYTTFGQDGVSEKVAPEDPYNAWMAILFNSMYRAGIDKDTASCFIKSESSKVRYRYLHTTDIIAPENIIKLSIDPFEETGKKHNKDYSYNVSYFVIDYGSPYFKELVKNTYAFENGEEISDTHQENDEAMNISTENDSEDNFVEDNLTEPPETPASYDDIADYARNNLGILFINIMSEEDYEKALELYDDEYFDNGKYLDTTMLTDKISELAESITQDADNNFDKAKLIEAYLRKYKYDTSVDLRGSENYIESFLFDTKSGYCVHYASAMVLMLRSLGIPARYANGYLHTYNEDGIVKSSEAHAWVEGYIEGIGWVRFEPTGSMESSEEASWGLTVKDTEELEDLYDYEQYVPNPEDFYMPYGSIPGQNNTSVNHGNTSRKNLGLGILIRLAIYLGSILGVIVLIYALIRLIIYIRYMSLTQEDRLRENVNIICRKISHLVPAGENILTIYGYLDYVEDEEQRGAFEKIFEEYYKVRYRGDTAKPDFVSHTRQMARKTKFK